MGRFLRIIKRRIKRNPPGVKLPSTPQETRIAANKRRWIARRRRNRGAIN